MYEDPIEAFQAIVNAMSEVAEKARSLGIHVVFGAMFMDEMDQDIYNHSEWNSLVAAGTIINHLQGRLSEVLSGYVFTEAE